jgi:hypothetical protein
MQQAAQIAQNALLETLKNGASRAKRRNKSPPSWSLRSTARLGN